MAYKLINATEAKEGTYIMVDGAPCVVRNIDISKTGKHGASKVRMEAIGVLDDKKRVVAVPGHERFEVPMIEKKRGQVLSITGDKASVMDVESFETIEIPFSQEVKEQLKESAQVEYWDVEGAKIIKRVMG